MNVTTFSVSDGVTLTFNSKLSALLSGQILIVVSPTDSIFSAGCSIPVVGVLNFIPESVNVTSMTLWAVLVVNDATWSVAFTSSTAEPSHALTGLPLSNTPFLTASLAAARLLSVSVWPSSTTLSIVMLQLSRGEALALPLSTFSSLI